MFFVTAECKGVMGFFDLSEAVGKQPTKGGVRGRVGEDDTPDHYQCRIAQALYLSRGYCKGRICSGLQSRSNGGMGT